MVIIEDKIIVMRDARELGGCVGGWQSFVETHGFVWKDVVLNGVLASELLATDDAMAEELVKFVYARDNLI